MSASATLNAELREKVGSRDARKLRHQGRIPATIQADANHDHINLHLSQAEFLTSRRAHAHLYDIEVGGKTHSAVVRELQYDALGSDIIHVEFKPVTRGVVTEAEVELTFVGMVADGVLTHNVTHVTVECLPSQIPDGIEVNVQGLTAGTHIKASDLPMPEGSKLVTDADTEIAVVSAARAEAEPAEDDEEGEGEGE